MRLTFRSPTPEPDDPAARVADLPNADMRPGVGRGRFLARLREVAAIRNAALHFRPRGGDGADAASALAGFAEAGGSG